MKNQIIVCSLVFAAFSASGFASIDQAPASFAYQGGKAVFVDFTKAEYSIAYSLASPEATADSRIEFTQPADGYVVFDLVPEIDAIAIDGVATTAKVVKLADGNTEVRVVGMRTSAGAHVLTIKNRFKEDVQTRREGVASVIWMNDLGDRGFLEHYLPASFEYDQLPMVFDVTIADAGAIEHEVFTNGALTTLSANQFHIETPPYYNSASFYFHLLPAATVKRIDFTYTSVDGRELPVVIYGSSFPEMYKTEVLRVLKELETDYGPFFHPSVTIYDSGFGTGGMEYPGATLSELSAVGHELFHSYNARGVMPANGNSGWMDEALSSWRDADYRTLEKPGYLMSKMGNLGTYHRSTSRDAYSKGRDFISWIAGDFEAMGLSMKTFLKGYFNDRKFQTTTTPDLIAALERYSGLALQSRFNRYIYGQLRVTDEISEETSSENPIHRPLTREQRKRLIFPTRR